tara:strand:+ start:6389 stop:6526 length:138 start_codon:yes stop_codon:yes gene_type:complete
MPRRPVDALEELDEIFRMMVKLERWGKRLLLAGVISALVALVILA